MLKKGSKVNSILTGSCPKCQNENMYVDSNPYHLGNVLKMHENCSHCGLKYQIEPSFFYGAMYVSYALGVALFVTIWVSCNLWFPSFGAWTQIGLVTFFTVVLSPYLFALSKIIYANFFIHYKADAQSRK
jgi:uncharacterized protein (DUF983 family)